MHSDLSKNKIFVKSSQKLQASRYQSSLFLTSVTYFIISILSEIFLALSQVFQAKEKRSLWMSSTCHGFYSWSSILFDIYQGPIWWLNCNSKVIYGWHLSILLHSKYKLSSKQSKYLNNQSKILDFCTRKWILILY